VLGADSASAGMDVLAREPVDLVVQDMNFRREATSGEEGVTLSDISAPSTPTCR